MSRLLCVTVLLAAAAVVSAANNGPPVVPPVVGGGAPPPQQRGLQLNLLVDPLPVLGAGAKTVVGMVPCARSCVSLC